MFIYNWSNFCDKDSLTFRWVSVKRFLSACRLSLWYLVKRFIKIHLGEISHLWNLCLFFLAAITFSEQWFCGALLFNLHNRCIWFFISKNFLFLLLGSLLLIRSLIELLKNSLWILLFQFTIISSSFTWMTQDNLIQN